MGDDWRLVDLMGIFSLDSSCLLFISDRSRTRATPFPTFEEKQYNIRQQHPHGSHRVSRTLPAFLFQLQKRWKSTWIDTIILMNFQWWIRATPCIHIAKKSERSLQRNSDIEDELNNPIGLRMLTVSYWGKSPSHTQIAPMRKLRTDRSDHGHSCNCENITGGWIESYLSLP